VGVTINTVAPGYIGTDMLQAVKPEALEKCRDDSSEAARNNRGDRIDAALRRRHPSGGQSCPELENAWGQADSTVVPRHFVSPEKD
jgi:NAD(P)-dependent dehydrogenase (short-subunit alcohol dehydrogenase family)